MPSGTLSPAGQELGGPSAVALQSWARIAALILLSPGNIASRLTSAGDVTAAPAGKGIEA
jgi:hypothetical protein